MSDGFNFIAIRGRRKSMEFWNPKHNGGIFDTNSYLENRANQVYEIRGLTIVNLEINGMVVNNGDLVVFNSNGVLIEVLGDGDLFDLGISAEAQPWVINYMTGDPVFFNHVLMDLSTEANISTDGSIVTGSGGDAFSTDGEFILSATTQVVTVTTNLSSFNSGAGTLFLGFSNNETTLIDIVVLGAMISPLGSGNYNITIGSVAGGDTFSLGTVALVPSDRISVGIDNTGAGGYKVYFYKNGTIVGSSYSPSGVTETLISFMTLIDFPTTVAVEHQPTYIVSGTDSFNTTTPTQTLIYPVDPINKAYVVSNAPAEGVYVNERTGLIYNGDWVFFGQSGTPVGRSFNPDLVPPGPAGEDGISITGVIDNLDGTFKLQFSNDTQSGNIVIPEGPQGEQGVQGIQGNAGTNGTNGTNGIDGSDGIDGISITGVIDNGNGTFKLTFSNSTESSNIVIPEGPQGDPGVDGTNGIDGMNGVNGVDGAPGADGVSIVDVVDNLDGTFKFTKSDASETGNVSHFVQPVLVENATLALTFATPSVYCTSFNATTGRPTAITGTLVGKVNYAGAKRGVIQTIYHDGTGFAAPSEWKLVGFISPLAGNLNRITCEYIHDGSTLPHVQYWCAQVAS